MDGYGPTTFGASIADIYDDHYANEVAPTDVKVRQLVEFAASRPVVDVGCGTGRMALALAAEGLVVTGVDASPEMLTRLKERDGAELVRRELADVTDQPIEGRYGLAYLLFETFIMVGDRNAQRRALRNITGALEPGGRLLVEISVFELDRWSDYVDSSVRVSSMSARHVSIGVSRYDKAAGRLDYQDVIISQDGVRLVPVTMHPISPAQLDELADGAGLTREAHWSDWAGTPYKRGGPSLVAVYRR